MKPLGIASLAALAGIVSLIALFPRLDPSASSGLTLDRKHAVERVRQLSLRYGVNSTGWGSAVTQSPAELYRSYLARYPDDPVNQLFGPLLLHVDLIAPGGRTGVSAVLLGDGRPLEWRWTPGGSLPAADAVMQDFVGDHRGRFVPADGKDETDTVRQSWDWSAGDRFPLRAKLFIEKSPKAVSIKLEPVYRDAFSADYRRSRKYPLGTAARVVQGLTWFASFCFCVWVLFRRRLEWRLPLVLLSVQVLWAGCSFLGGRYYQDLMQMRMARPNLNFDLGDMAAKGEVSLWSFFWLFLLAAAALALRKASDRDRWLSLDLISQGKVANRVVGGALAIGILSGIVIAAIPYLVAKFLSAPLETRFLDLLVAPASLTESLRLSAAVPALGLFGFLLPAVRGWRFRPLSWALFTAVGMCVLVLASPFHATVPALVTAALLLSCYLLIYLRLDLLAVVAAMIAERAVLVPAVLLSQPVSALRESASELLAVGAVLLGASVYWAVRGREPDEEPERFPSELAGEGETPQKSNRERLEAEFQVARKAQQDVLPVVPPLLEGYSLAGWCEPAQQVGGDLYDYFPLPDGRLGIAVADVSGKGVPAALYMMVTKGLLSAASRDSNQLAYILEQINLHLYRACRKKVFVTMAAVVLDSTSRRVEYGRAGHNPVVWRRPRRGETTLVKPPGLGLGMTPNERFTRTLKIEELELDDEDAIVLYSDGVTEAVNHLMEQFGEERLLRSVESTDGQSAQASRDTILRDLANFMGKTPPRDDITLVVIRGA